MTLNELSNKHPHIYVYNPYLVTSILITDIDVNGDYVYSCISDLSNMVYKYRKNKLYYSNKKNESYFLKNGKRYYIGDFIKLYI